MTLLLPVDAGEQVVVMYVAATRFGPGRGLASQPHGPIERLASLVELVPGVGALQDTKGRLSRSIVSVFSGRLPPSERDRKPRHIDVRGRFSEPAIQQTNALLNPPSQGPLKRGIASFLLFRRANCDLAVGLDGLWVS